mgnify:CR=1 FL=1
MNKAKNLSNRLLAQLNLFYLALSFFTRLPIPQNVNYTSDLLNQSNRYFSLVGLLLGIIIAGTFYIFSFIFPLSINILLIMVVSLLLTGAFHEDGLTDMADGIGGAFEPEQRLTIMKDSRIGTYGAVTLIMAMTLKFSLLLALAQNNHFSFIAAVLLSYPLSRTLAASLISALPYVTDENDSKSKPLAQVQSKLDLFILVLVSVIPSFLFSLNIVCMVALTLLLFRVAFIRWLKAKIGGFTGDCLGAAQQIAELLIYLVLVAFLNELEEIHRVIQVGELF